MQPLAALAAGIGILDPVLCSSGFVFHSIASGRGSGGDYAYGEYVRHDRRLQLHFRYALGLVTYHVGAHTLAHESYMRALGASPTEAQYPGYSEDPLDGFRHLAADLQRFGAEFLSGDAAVLMQRAPLEAESRAAAWRKQQAFYEGDDSKRQAAMQLIHAGDYARAAANFDAVHYPDLLTVAERRAWELARARAVASPSAP